MTKDTKEKKIEEDFFIKIRPIGDKSYCVVRRSDFKSAVESWLESMESEQELVVSMIELTEEEFEKMPEYEG